MEKHEGEKIIAVIKELMGGPPAAPGKDRGRQQLDARAHAGDGDGAAREARALPKPDRGPALEALIPVVEGKGGAPDAVILGADVLEAIYYQFKNRLLDDLTTDPIFLELLATRQEIIIEIAPRRITLDGSTLRGRVARLIAAGWFVEARKVGTCRQELARTGNDPGGGGSLKGHLDDFVTDGFLVRFGDGFQVAPAIKVSEKVLEVV